MQKQGLLGLWGTLESTVTCLPVPAWGQHSLDKVLVTEHWSSFCFTWLWVTQCPLLLHLVNASAEVSAFLQLCAQPSLLQGAHRHVRSCYLGSRGWKRTQLAITNSYPLLQEHCVLCYYCFRIDLDN